MVEKSGAGSPAVHPMVRDLLAAGAGKTLAMSGYVGPAAEGRLRLYADLGLRVYVELARSDVVRVIDSTDKPQGPSTVLIKRDAEVTYVESTTMRVDQALAAALTAPLAAGSGCGCGSADGATSMAQQTGGGPVVSVCSWGCTERLQLCIARSGTFGQLWCYFNYAACRLGCTVPVVST